MAVPFDAKSKVFGETLYTKLHFGAEYKLFIFIARFGFNQGYPTIGFGLNALPLKFDYAYYTDELGMYAGQNPSSKHMITLALRFGAGGGKMSASGKKAGLGKTDDIKVVSNNLK